MPKLFEVVVVGDIISVENLGNAVDGKKRKGVS